MYHSHKLGLQAEQFAQRFLKQQKLHLVAKNYHCRYGEIDLIMRESEFFVFVEVRTRTHNTHGSAIATVDFKKQQKLKKTAQFYLQTHQLLDKVACRFDVLAVSLTNKEPSFEWVKNAF